MERTKYYYMEGRGREETRGRSLRENYKERERREINKRRDGIKL